MDYQFDKPIQQTGDSVHEMGGGRVGTTDVGCGYGF